MSGKMPDVRGPRNLLCQIYRPLNVFCTRVHATTSEELRRCSTTRLKLLLKPAIAPPAVDRTRDLQSAESPVTTCSGTRNVSFFVLVIGPKLHILS